MSERLHVYRAPFQRATNFVDPHLPGRPKRYRCNPRKLWWVDCCDTRRWAKYVLVQVYYDGVRRFCADGHGCRR